MNENTNAIPAEQPAVITLAELEGIVLPGDAPAIATEEEQRKPFSIADDDCADWAVRKIAAEKAELDRFESMAAQQKSEIDHKLEAARHRFEANTSFLTGCLANYFETVPAGSIKTTKTAAKYRLLSGVLVKKLGQPKADHDDTKLTAWLKANGMADYVKTEEKPMWADLKKELDLTGEVAVVKSTGEIVDGVSIAKAPDVFSVDV